MGTMEKISYENRINNKNCPLPRGRFLTKNIMNNQLKILFLEALGTSFLVLVIALTGNALAIGVTLAVLVAIGGPISGGHYNPAVTCAMWIRQKITTRKAGKYILAQCTGGFIGACIAGFLTNDVFLPTPPLLISSTAVVVTEIVFTFLLAVTVIFVTTRGDDIHAPLAGIAIGGALFVGISAGGGLSGAVYNPAVAIGPYLLHWSVATDPMRLLWYIVGPILGGILAGFVGRVALRSTKTT